MPDGYMLSTDPFFIEKGKGIVGLYLNPPENAVVLCVDEKRQNHTLDTTQPLRPMGMGYVEGVTHDDILHGTSTLFAAQDVATGAMIAECKSRHRHQEFLCFQRRINKEERTHKHAKVKAWLAQRPRFHVHYTPTHATWLTQVARWFGLNNPTRDPPGQLLQRLATGFRAAVRADRHDQAIRGC